MNIIKYLQIEKSRYAEPIYLNQWKMESDVEYINYNDFVRKLYEYRMRIMLTVSFHSDDESKDSFISALSQNLNHALYGDLVDKLIEIKCNASNKNWDIVDDKLNKLLDEYIKV